MKLLIVFFLTLATRVLGAPASSDTSALQKPKLNFVAPHARYPESPIKTTSNVATITRVQSPRGAKRVNKLFQSHLAGKSHGFAPTIPEEFGADYVTKVRWGDQTFLLVIDTGSSDTWITEKEFQCISTVTFLPADESACEFGDLFSPSKTFTRIKDQRFDITYGDGTYARGIMGTDTITFAGIQVVGQEVGVANEAAWQGDGSNSGIIGLAFPAITNAYPQSDRDTGPFNRIVYDPLFTTMVKSGQVPPVFSMSIMRNATGDIAIGGVSQAHASSSFFTAPFEYVAIDGTPIDKLQYYAVNASVTIPGGKPSPAPPHSNTTSSFSAVPTGHAYDRRSTDASDAKSPLFHAIIDSGTTLILLPQDVADAVNAAFRPPANGLGTLYSIQCGAVPPPIKINIGGHAFPIDLRDLIVYADDGTCYSGVGNSGENSAILGDRFLSNVIATYDVGAGLMKFAEHKY